MYKDLLKTIEILKFRIGKYNGCPPITWLMKEVNDIEGEAYFSHHFGLIDDIELETLEEKLRNIVQDACSNTTSTKG